MEFYHSIHGLDYAKISHLGPKENLFTSTLTSPLLMAGGPPAANKESQGSADRTQPVPQAPSSHHLPWMEAVLTRLSAWHNLPILQGRPPLYPAAGRTSRSHLSGGQFGSTFSKAFETHSPSDLTSLLLGTALKETIQDVFGAGSARTLVQVWLTVVRSCETHTESRHPGAGYVNCEPAYSGTPSIAAKKVLLGKKYYSHAKMFVMRVCVSLQRQNRTGRRISVSLKKTNAAWVCVKKKTGKLYIKI